MLKKIILVVSIMALFGLAIVVLKNILPEPPPAPTGFSIVVPVSARVPRAEAATVEQNIGVPVRIKIPSISVNAVINKAAVEADGSMGVPKLPGDTAWYMLGPKPGENGNAVIAGHVNWLYGAKAVFENLRKLKPGDKIMVQDENGAIISFVVRESRTYDALADATPVFSSTDGKAHLNLITCGGVWNKRTKQYSKRLVVFADKEVK